MCALSVATGSEIFVYVQVKVVFYLFSYFFVLFILYSTYNPVLYTKGGVKYLVVFVKFHLFVIKEIDGKRERVH